MSKTDAPPPLPHEVRYERELFDAPYSGDWREHTPTPNARASCTCGQLDTGYIGASAAYRAAQEHVKVCLPGVDWGPDIDGPAQPEEQP